MDLNKDDYSSEAQENESEESEEEVQEIESTLITKPKTKLAVWNFFRIESDSDGHPSNTNAKQKHLGCKKVRGQSEVTLQTDRHMSFKELLE